MRIELKFIENKTKPNRKLRQNAFSVAPAYPVAGFRELLLREGKGKDRRVENGEEMKEKEG